MAAVDVEVDGGVAVITLNRPQVHNAMNPEVQVRLFDAWRLVRDDASIRVAILTGAGERAFCSGGDLQELIPLLTRARPPCDEWDRRLLEEEALGDPAKPVIAAVNGYAVSGGMELVMSTDIRIAAEHARFGLQEVKWGLFPSGASTVRLPRQIPPALAMEMMLTGDLISAERAAALGLVNRVVPATELMGAAMEVARKIAANGPLAVQAIRASAKECSGRPEAEAIAIEGTFAAPVFASEDAVEGPKAFLEKRPPRFEGR
jgi:enoyl-CoA hydratase